MLFSYFRQFRAKGIRAAQVARNSVALVVALVSTFGFFGCTDTNSSSETSTKTVSQTENPAAARQIKTYLAENFGMTGYKTSWYDNISDVTVAGDTVTVKTNLPSKNENAGRICGGVSSFVFSNENRSLGLSVVKVLSQSGSILINRRGIGEQCS